VTLEHTARLPLLLLLLLLATCQLTEPGLQATLLLLLPLMCLATVVSACWGSMPLQHSCAPNQPPPHSAQLVPQC
jgi:hypothetical protein